MTYLLLLWPSTLSRRPRQTSLERRRPWRVPLSPVPRSTPMSLLPLTLVDRVRVDFSSSVGAGKWSPSGAVSVSASISASQSSPCAWPASTARTAWKGPSRAGTSAIAASRAAWGRSGRPVQIAAIVAAGWGSGSPTSCLSVSSRLACWKCARSLSSYPKLNSLL